MESLSAMLRYPGDGVSAYGAALILLLDRFAPLGIRPPSSPRGSAARGSSGTRTALVFARFLGCASAVQSVDLCDRDIGMCLDSTGLPCMHAAHPVAVMQVLDHLPTPRRL